MRPADLRTHAITDATVIPSPGQKIEHATIIIRDGVIEHVFYPVFPPDRNAEQVLEWLAGHSERSP